MELWNYLLTYRGNATVQSFLGDLLPQFDAHANFLAATRHGQDVVIAIASEAHDGLDGATCFANLLAESCR